MIPQPASLDTMRMIRTDLLLTTFHFCHVGSRGSSDFATSGFLILHSIFSRYCAPPSDRAFMVEYARCTWHVPSQFFNHFGSFISIIPRFTFTPTGIVFQRLDVANSVGRDAVLMEAGMSTISGAARKREERGRLRPGSLVFGAV